VTGTIVEAVPVRQGSVVDARLGDYVRGPWPALVRYATALCGDPTEAEELVQSALVRVALRWPFVRDKDNPDGYVRRAIVNGYLTTWRRLRSRETSMAEPPDVVVATDAAAGVDDVVTVRRALAALPPRQRAVLVLRYLEDRSEQETADLLGCSVGTVKSQASKALAKLRGAR
jgi:RNA polymerase sigma-70 factor (sigma-E family)